MKGIFRILCVLFIMVFVVNVGYADAATNDVNQTETIFQNNLIDDFEINMSIPEVLLQTYSNPQDKFIYNHVKFGYFTENSLFSDGSLIHPINNNKDNKLICLYEIPITNETILNFDNSIYLSNSKYYNSQVGRFVKHEGKFNKSICI